MTTAPTYDIAFLGTSLTSNRVGNWQKSFKARMQRTALGEIRCYDCGMPGGTSLDILNTYSGRAGLLMPRAVVIEAGMNDAPPGQGISVAQFKTNITQIINIVADLSPNSDIFVMTMNPVVVPPGSAVNAAALPNYYQGLRDVSASESVGLIDVTPLWGSPTTTQIPDGVHPTVAAANQVLIPKLLSTFAPLVNG